MNTFSRRGQGNSSILETRQQLFSRLVEQFNAAYSTQNVEPAGNRAKISASINKLNQSLLATRGHGITAKDFTFSECVVEEPAIAKINDKGITRRVPSHYIVEISLFDVVVGRLISDDSTDGNHSGRGMCEPRSALHPCDLSFGAGYYLHPTPFLIFPDDEYGENTFQRVGHVRPSGDLGFTRGWCLYYHRNEYTVESTQQLLHQRLTRLIEEGTSSETVQNLSAIS